MIGRKKEIQELNALYDSKKAELVAVFGRRRVGKTYLIDETFKDRITFRHAGISPIEHKPEGILKKQLEAFYYSLLRAGMKPSGKPKSWMEAFFMLETFLDSINDGSRQLIFIDELPWMDTRRSGFITAFENFWNGWACYHDNVMVIVCGSANSWMLDNLINNHGGLYGRVTYEIKLVPFTLRECELFFEEKGIILSRYEIIQAFMAIGGIPFYLGYFKREFSFAQNIDELFFKESAKLKLEFDRLFDSVFENPEFIKKTVKFIYTRRTGYTRSEIVKALKTSDGAVMAKCLNALATSGFIDKYVPFGAKANESRYKLVDPFCLFYLRFIENNDNLSEDFWLQNLESQQVVTWRGLAFESVGFSHIKQIKTALGISGVSTTQSAWIKKATDDEDGTQADMLITRKDNIINLCESKFYSSPFVVDKEYYNTMLKRIELLRTHIPDSMAIHCTLITTAGLKDNSYSGIFTNVITLDDLFQ